MLLCQEISEKFHDAVGKRVEFVELWNWTKINKFRKIFAIPQKKLNDPEVQKTSNFGIKLGRVKCKYSETPFFVSAIDCDTREFYDFAISYLRKIRPNTKPFEIIKKNKNGEISKNPNIIIITEGSCWPRKTLDYKRGKELIGQILLSETYLFAVGNFKRGEEEIHCEHNDGEIIILKEDEILDFYEAFEFQYPEVRLQRVNKEKEIYKEDKVWRNKKLLEKIKRVEGESGSIEKTKEIEGFDENYSENLTEDSEYREMNPYKFHPWQRDLIQVLGVEYAHYFKKINDEQAKYEKKFHKNYNFKKDITESLSSKISNLLTFKENGENYTNRFFFDSVRELVKEFGSDEVKSKERYFFDYVFSFLCRTSKKKEDYFLEFCQTVSRVSEYMNKNGFVGKSLELIALPSFLLERAAALPEHGEKTEFVLDFLKYIYNNFNNAKGYIFHSSTLRRTIYPFSGSVCEAALREFKLWVFERLVSLIEIANKGEDLRLIKGGLTNKQIYAQTRFVESLNFYLASSFKDEITRGPPLLR